jgi:hypothetical protein
MVKKKQRACWSCRVLLKYHPFRRKENCFCECGFRLRVPKTRIR